MVTFCIGLQIQQLHNLTVANVLIQLFGNDDVSENFVVTRTHLNDSRIKEEIEKITLCSDLEKMFQDNEVEDNLDFNVAIEWIFAKCLEIEIKKQRKLDEIEKEDAELI